MNCKEGRLKLSSLRNKNLKNEKKETESKDKHTHCNNPRRWSKMGKVFEEIMAENFPSLMKDMNINIQEDQQTLSEMNSEIHTETHENQTFNKQRENLESRKREGTHYIQVTLSKISRFLSRNFSG